MNQKFKKACEEIKILQEPEIQKTLGGEMETLHDLGVKCHEIEFLVGLKIKEDVAINN